MRQAPPPDVVFVVPIAPAPTGNGLAMRAGMWLECIATHAAVDLVVVPVAGPADVTQWARRQVRDVHVAPPPTDSDEARAQTTAQLADPVLRDRLAQTQPLPDRARRAPASLATALADRFDRRVAPVVLTMREYLVPFGVHLASRIGARRVVVDLDDDAEAVLRQLGQGTEADGYGRLARAWLPDADAVTAASPAEARSMTSRYGLAVTTVPNAIRVPPAPTVPPGRARMLFIGNLTYDPNVAAVVELVDEVFPLVRSSLPGATVTLVGATDGRIDALRDRPGVDVTGPVPDVAPFYADADIVVVPLRSGAGTRIKVLESMAHRRPVVATPAAVSGLGFRDTEVAVADAPDALAADVIRLLTGPAERSAMVESAFATVTRSHTVEAMAPMVRRIVLGAADDAQAGVRET